ncbi:hypothetical protein B0H12DRAFT_1241216 [Mycena haematopus]|nr:hypothetical protein B0H12DRAFT_1241216 [Mycena haematopus]
MYNQLAWPNAGYSGRCGSTGIMLKAPARVIAEPAVYDATYDAHFPPPAGPADPPAGAAAIFASANRRRPHLPHQITLARTAFQADSTPFYLLGLGACAFMEMIVAGTAFGTCLSF